MRTIKEGWVFFTPDGVWIGTPHCFPNWAQAREDFLKLAERKEWKHDWIPFEEPDRFRSYNVTTDEGVSFRVNFQKVSK